MDNEESWGDDPFSTASLEATVGMRSSDFPKLLTLEMEVNTTQDSIAVLGDIFPSLTELKLCNSTVPTTRDLGTSFHNLTVLWLRRSGVRDLGGISALVKLKELYLAFNDITDLSPLALHDCLETLDVDSNCINDINQLSILGTCPAMTSLNLVSNPVSYINGYRKIVVQRVPTLSVLDDEEVTTEDREVLTAAELGEAIKSASGCNKGSSNDRHRVDQMQDGKLEEELMIVEGIKTSGFEDSTTRGCISGRSSIANSFISPRANFVLRPASARGLRTKSYTETRPSTAVSFPSYNRHGSTRMDNLVSSLNFDKAPVDDPSSDLTHGSDIIFAGNTALAMRRRQKESGASTNSGSDALNSNDSDIDLAFSPSVEELKESIRSDFTISECKTESKLESTSSPVAEQQHSAPYSNAGDTKHEDKEGDSWRRTYLQQSKLNKKVWTPNESVSVEVSHSDILAITIGSYNTSNNGPTGKDSGFSNSIFEHQRRNNPVPETLLNKRKPLVGGKKQLSHQRPFIPPLSNVELSPNNTPEKEVQLEGAANSCLDEDLVVLLKHKPKRTKFLQTKEAFKKFFSGFDRSRMKYLLEQAYDTYPEEERQLKIVNRMSLLE